MQLRELLRVSGWSGQKLATVVNALGAENGLVLHYDRTSVAHWLSGTRPSQPVAQFVAEALSRRLGRLVSPGDTGLVRARDIIEPMTNRAHEDPVDQLRRLAGSEVGRRETLRSVQYRISLSVVPDILDLAAAVPAVAHDRESIGPAQAEAANLMLSVFSATDIMLGGGVALTALSAYLGVEVSSWLRAPASPAVRARLCSAAARLANLAAWMCFDDTVHGAAQRYYRAAAHLAALVSDTGCYAAALRGMSLQAHYLGHHRAALNLAVAAGRLSQRVPTAEAAFLAGQLGVAYAACGHPHTALSQIRVAERLLHRAVETDQADDYHSAVLANRQAEALATIGDRNAAIRALARSLRHLSPATRRDRALTAARLGELYLDTGRINQACAAWAILLDDYPYLSSGRVHHAILSMRARLRPYQTYAPARALLVRMKADKRAVDRSKS